MLIGWYACHLIVNKCQYNFLTKSIRSRWFGLFRLDLKFYPVQWTFFESGAIVTLPCLLYCRIMACKIRFLLEHATEITTKQAVKITWLYRFVDASNENNNYSNKHVKRQQCSQKYTLKRNINGWNHHLNVTAKRTDAGWKVLPHKALRVFAANTEVAWRELSCSPWLLRCSLTRSVNSAGHRCASKHCVFAGLTRAGEQRKFVWEGMRKRF